MLLQALGKVASGTWLGGVPANLFVFAGSVPTAAFLLALSRRGVGEGLSSRSSS